MDASVSIISSPLAADTPVARIDRVRRPELRSLPSAPSRRTREPITSSFSLATTVVGTGTSVPWSASSTVYSRITSCAVSAVSPGGGRRITRSRSPHVTNNVSLECPPGCRSTSNRSDGPMCSSKNASSARRDRRVGRSTSGRFHSCIVYSHSSVILVFMPLNV